MWPRAAEHKLVGRMRPVAHGLDTFYYITRYCFGTILKADNVTLYCDVMCSYVDLTHDHTQSQ